jgi:hypothetical protein
MTNYSKDIIEDIFHKESKEDIKDKIESILNDKVGIRIAQEGVNVARNSMSLSEEEEAVDKADIQGTLDDIGLDPVMDREYFLKSFEVGDALVTIKTIGVGKNKPVSVYIDNVRWEFFAGPGIAEKEVKSFIDSPYYEKWLEAIGANNATEEKEEPEPTEESEPTKEDDTEDNKKEETPTTNESVISKLKNVTDNVEFVFENEQSKIIIDEEQANTIVAVYESLNTNNKDSFREMLNSSRADFIKILNFSFEQSAKTGDSNDESR